MKKAKIFKFLSRFIEKLDLLLNTHLICLLLKSILQGLKWGFIVRGCNLSLSFKKGAELRRGLFQIFLKLVSLVEGA